MIQDIFPHKYNVSYKHPVVKDDDTVLVYSQDSLLCFKENNEVEFPTAAQLAPACPDVKGNAKFMFCIDGTNYFELRSPKLDPFDKWTYLPKEEFRGIKPLWRAFAAITALQIHSFYTNNTYCGRCGGKLSASYTERAMICSNCQRTVYPQICPSVIVGVVNDDKLLLTRYSSNHSKFKRYALVAGYNEVGESLEDTVRREVMEEVGLKVKNIRYFKSQPWSFTDSLLAGFFCDVDGDATITLDTNELSEAVWLTRDEIPDESADPTISLTGTMIYTFKYSIFIGDE